MCAQTSMQPGDHGQQPAQALREALRELCWTARDLAWALGYSLPFVESLLDHTSFTPKLALQLEAAGLGEAETWLNLQRNHDLFELRDHLAGELALIRSVVLRVGSDQP